MDKMGADLIQTNENFMGKLCFSHASIDFETDLCSLNCRVLIT